jgi:hypothetical protein
MKLHPYLQVYIIFILNFLIITSSYSQQTMAIGDSNPKDNAILYLKGNGTQGLIIPIVSSLGNFGESGMVVYNSGDKKIYYHDGSNWISIGSSSSDLNIGNEVSQVGANGALVITGAGSVASPLTVSLVSGTSDGQILRWNATTSKWTLATSTGLSSSLTSTQIYVGNGSNVAAPVPLSGDATLSNAGALTIANNAVNSNKIADGTITTADILDGTIASTDVLDGAIMNVDINPAAAISGSKISPNFGAQNIITTGSVSTSALNASGAVTFNALSGAGVRMVTADAAGVLSTQSIPPAAFSTLNVIPKGNGTTLAASQLFDNGTNVGIGTLTPTFKLEVEKTLASAADAQLRLYNPSNTTGDKSGVRLSVGSSWAVHLQTVLSGDWLQLTDNAGTAVHRWGYNTYYPGAGNAYVQGNGTSLSLLGGNVGIGNASPTYPLDVVGGIKLTGYIYFSDNRYLFHVAGSYSGIDDHWIPNLGNTYDLGTSTYRWRTLYTNSNPNVSSDIRLKKNIRNLNYGLSEIMNLRPVSYSFKTDNENKTSLGLIAQEVKEIIPEIVVEDTTPEKIMGVTYSDLIPVLIHAIQQQQKIIEDQKLQLEKLQADIKIEASKSNQETSELNALKTEIAEIKRIIGSEAKAK